jgi:hypothetical protein
MRPLAIALVGLVLGQPGNVLNGNWTANFQGTTYVRLAFAEGATVPQGTMSIGQSIHVDDEGNVDRVTAASSTPTRMLDIRWNDGVLSFGINDGPDVDKFEFRPIDANHAELAPILSVEERRQLAAEQIPLPKPFRLTKTP